MLQEEDFKKIIFELNFFTNNNFNYNGQEMHRFHAKMFFNIVDKVTKKE